MTKDERMDGGWKLVRLDASPSAHRFTIKQIMAAAGISRGQVTFMRKVLNELGPKGHEHDRWKAALRAHQNKPDTEYTDEEIEDMNDVQANEVADKIARIIGTRWADRPKVLARVVEIYSGRRLPEVVRELQDRNGFNSQGWEGEDEFPDF
jgi:hypothetical protein